MTINYNQKHIIQSPKPLPKVAYNTTAPHTNLTQQKINKYCTLWR